ncbi:hypothetical protein HNY73_019438 [Argiope bruennichi]|uniref:DUF5641 domain-containing protein n=1 Tax=Argiope bruennichi TaxID=94029 RepID=A0A8T0E633_ARGBR|nr:hypothetical protein HNY73_019438 [Argiope bruennichi]
MWPMAKLLEVYPGKDKNVRVMRLKTPRGEIVRPVRRIYPLEIKCTEDESSLSEKPLTTRREVKTFEQLKELMITDQLEYRVPAEVREHFHHEWIDMKTPHDLVEKLDEYESNKQSFRRDCSKKNSYKFQTGGHYNGSKAKEVFNEVTSKFQIKKEPVNEKGHEKEFEKRLQLRC